MKAQPFVRGLSFGEGVRWRDGRFWYSDFYKQHVASVAPDGSTRVEVQIDDQPSGLGWLPDGRLLVVAMKTQRLLRREPDGRMALHARPRRLCQNFMPTTWSSIARGNAFIGCFGFDLDLFIEQHGVGPLFAEPDLPPTAPILMVTPAGAVSIASPDHKFPNGMALIGNTRLVMAECALFPA